MDTQKGQLVNDAVLSVLIVSYNTRDLTLECLKSVFEQTQGVDFEVLVVDNASADGSAEAIASAYPQVELIASNENLGFGQACNLAAKRSTGRWLVLLNPDTVVLDHALTRMFEFAKSQGPRTFIGGRTFYPDGRLEPRSCSGRPTVWSTFCFSVGLASLFRRTRCFDPESLGAWERDSSREVDIIAGCLLMTSREFWDELGGFDQDFFMYGEDYDLCLRARKGRRAQRTLSRGTDYPSRGGFGGRSGRPSHQIVQVASHGIQAPYGDVSSMARSALARPLGNQSDRGILATE